MKNVNIGIANLMISNKLNESYFNDSLASESKKITLDFFNVIKESPLLQLEFKVYDNIENKSIINDFIATRYIDNNIKLFEVYTLEELNAEHKKLEQFFIQDVEDLNEEKVNLYNSINNLIIESLKNYDEIDVDNIHESFTCVLNHIKKDKNLNEISSINSDEINEDVIEIAVNKFNEKYYSMNEDDKNLLQKLIKSTKKEKQELFESYKNDDLTILSNINANEINEEVQNAINNINNMKFNKDTVDDDIIKLHELKKDLS